MSTTEKPRRAAVYTRLSQDRTGDELGVTRQREDADTLIAQRGWTFAGEYRDDNLSAAGKRARPEFARLLADVTDRRVDVIVAWSLDRLCRTGRDRLALIEACQRAGVTISLCRGSDMDPTTPGGRLVLGMLGEVAQHEIAAKSDRQARAARQRRESGISHPGRRAFGYQADQLTPHPVEGPALTDAAHAFLAGASLLGIARGWNADGLLSTSGKPWTATTVGQVLARPRNCGRLGTARHGSRPAEIGAVRVGAVSLLDDDTFAAVSVKLGDPGRRTQTSTSRVLLGSFLYRCGACGAPMRSGGYGARGQARYACSGPAGCQRRAAGPIDTLVAVAVAMHLDRVSLPTGQGPDVTAARQRREALRVIRQEIRDDRDAGLISRAERDRSLAVNAAALAECEEIIAAAEAHTPLAALGPNAGAGFLAAGIDRQRAVLVALGVTVVVLPVRPGHRPGADSVRLDWA